jgi:cytidylate kinase
MIRVITIEREYGSGGGEIATKLAARLGWKLWDQLLTEEIARRLDCDSHSVEQHEERRDPTYYRLLKSFMRGSFEGSLNAPRLNIVDTAAVRELTRKLVTEIATAGNCVIVGRGSAYHLCSRADVFHAFIYAPIYERVRRLEAMGKSADEAEELAETVDRDRADFIKRYFNIDWPARQCFHLMVNSAMGDEVAVETILGAVKQFESSRGSGSPE